MSNTTRLSVLVAACALALSACSSTDRGKPVPVGSDTSGSGSSTTDTSGTAHEDDDYGAPPITNPLDAQVLLDDPCKSISPEQAAQLALNPKSIPTDKQSAELVGPHCSWKDAANRQFITVGYVVKNTKGLRDIYRAQQQGQWKYFDPITVNGYPGVFAHAVDGRKMGSCNTIVGVNDSLAFNVTIDGAPVESACEDSKRIAAAVVDTLKSLN